MSRTLTERDEGKTVVDAAGEEIGTIDRVEHGTVYADADEGVLDTVESVLGWDESEGTHTVVGSDVADVTNEEVRLREGW